MDLDMLYTGWTKFEADAVASLERYNRHLQLILSNFGVTHEAEAIAKAFTKLHSHIQERKDKTDIEDLIAKAIVHLWAETTRDFWAEFDRASNEEPASDEDVLRKASAWYVVTYRHKENQHKFLSFPWVVSRQLAEIKLLQKSQMDISRFLSSKPFVRKLDSELLSSEKNLRQLDQAVTNLLDGFSYNVSKETLRLASRLLLQWAFHCRLCVTSVDCTLYEWKQKIQVTTLVRLFLYRVEDACKNHSPMVNSPVGLFLEFLRFSVSLRFKSMHQAQKLLPLHVPKSKYLGKLAMRTLHHIAIEGHLACVGITDDWQTLLDHREMEPLCIPLHLGDQVQDNDYQDLKAMLKEWTGVIMVHIRPKQNGLMVSAAGTLHAIHSLQVLLQKDVQFLKRQFRRGFLE